MYCLTLQVSQSSVEEVCSEFGELKVCYIHQPSEFCLIYYSTIEEASQAKAALDKSPSINGVNVTVEFASESDIKDICEHLQVRLDLDKQQHQDEAVGPKHQSWGFNPTSQPSPAASQSKSSTLSSSSQWGKARVSVQVTSTTGMSSASSLENSGNAGSNNNSSSGNTGSLFNRQSSELSTPGSSSVWSDPGFLSGFSSPWQSGFSSSGAISGGSGINSGSFSLTSPQQGSVDVSSVNNNNSANGEPFLPNDLF